MLSRIIAFLLLSATVSASFCTFKGCKDGTVCSCVPFFSKCDVSTEEVGLCTMTEAGMWVAGVIGLLILVLLAVAIICLCLCCCCKGCCRGTKKVVHAWEDDPRTHSK